MLNQTTLMGRLTRDPELRRTGTGVACTSFSIANEADFPNKTTGERETDFFDCVAWRQTGEYIAKYFKKGQMIVVSGRLKNRSWTDKNGTKRVSTELIVENIYNAGPKMASGDAPASAAPATNAAGEPVDDGYAILDDDADEAQLPF